MEGCGEEGTFLKSSSLPTKKSQNKKIMVKVAVTTGCPKNVVDSEGALGVLCKEGFGVTNDVGEAGTTL